MGLALRGSVWETVALRLLQALVPLHSPSWGWHDQACLRSSGESYRMSLQKSPEPSSFVLCGRGSNSQGGMPLSQLVAAAKTTLWRMNIATNLRAARNETLNLSLKLALLRL